MSDTKGEERHIKNIEETETEVNITFGKSEAEIDEEETAGWQKTKRSTVRHVLLKVSKCAQKKMAALASKAMPQCSIKRQSLVVSGVSKSNAVHLPTP